MARATVRSWRIPPESEPTLVDMSGSGIFQLAQH